MLAWYRRRRRDLPWRRTRDPYRIWISEIMLQQTRVDVVVPYYLRFVERFPDVRALAAAPLTDVLQAWAGLGYYRRARHLHAAAAVLVAQHGGRMPRDPGLLAELPGVGPYTAGAIRSIAFGEPAPILDGNVVRVFARLFAVEDDVAGAPTRRRMWDWASRWAGGRNPGDANQALMELGATCCVKPLPDCARCPLEAYCLARRNGRERDLPRPRARPAGNRFELEAALLTRGDRILLVRRAAGALLRDWWELPACRGRSREAAGRELARRLRERLQIELADARSLAALRHGILGHRLDVTLLTGRARTARSPARARGRAHGSPRRRTATPVASLDLEKVESRWVSAAACRQLPLSTLARKALRAAAAHDPRWRPFLPAGFP